MDLTRTFLRIAATRPHVLLVEVPGGTAARLAVEQEMRERGWPGAVSPAGADLLVVAGPVDRRFTPLVQNLWRQVPRPRVRLQLPDAQHVGAALDRARDRLADGGDPVSADVGQNPHRHSRPAPEGSETDMPADLPMADRGEDRDGLMLDQLHIPLGPLLPDWPAGLVVHTVLQGDVIQEARIEVLRAHQPDDGSLTGAAVPLDRLGRLLAVAGWDDAAARARRVRDDLRAGAGGEPALPRLARQLRRSRTLRWLTDGVGVLPGTRSDVTARWQSWLDAAERGVDAPPHDATALADLLAGTELGSARLIVASLDAVPAEVLDG